MVLGGTVWNRLQASSIYLIDEVANNQSHRRGRGIQSEVGRGISHPDWNNPTYHRRGMHSVCVSSMVRNSPPPRRRYLCFSSVLIPSSSSSPSTFPDFCCAPVASVVTTNYPNVTYGRVSEWVSAFHYLFLFFLFVCVCCHFVLAFSLSLSLPRCC